MKRKCLSCGKEICKQNKSGYCRECLIKINRQNKIQKWLDTGDTSCGVDTTIRGAIREYILNQQENKCAICNMPNIWNNIEINFILDHIDGDASNSSKENLRLICPNCDSQLETYKSKNKKSARNLRKKYLHENYSNSSNMQV